MKKSISDRLSEGKILILDGATGTMIQRFNLDESDFCSGIPERGGKELKGNNECLNLSRPDIIRKIHDEYIRCGADIIESNTFSANSISQEEYGCASLAFDMAAAGARIAREAADEAYARTGRQIFVAGSIGPTSKSLSLSPDMDDPAFRSVTFDRMAEAYREQIKGLMLGGADMLLLETCFDALNAKAAIYALEKLLEEPEIQANPAIRSRLDDWGYFPLIVSVSVSDRSGRTLTGQTIEAFYTAVRHYPLTAFGLNCSLGADEMFPLLKEVAGFAGCAVSCYPNAGLPDGMGGYAETPDEMASAMERMASEGLLNIAGGCCGTTPEYIRAIADTVRKYHARDYARSSSASEAPSAPDEGCCVSGLEPVHIDLKRYNFTNIGERTNVAGSRKFARLIASGDYAEAIRIAAGQIGNGASVIDINMDDAMLDSTSEMEKFVRYISNEPAVAKAALMIDSSHWETILAGLKNAQGKSIVNSISLKEGEEEFLRKAREIHALGAAMVVMAFDEQGQATDFKRKIEICRRAYDLLTRKAGISPCDIIFDVNVLAVGTGIEEHAGYAIDFIRAVRWIKENLPGALTSGGISNLSFSFRGNNPVREAMHSVFLYHAINAGLDMAIVNPGMVQIYDEIEPELLRCVEDVILDTDAGATERLIVKAQETAAGKEACASGNAGNHAPQHSPATSPEERIAEALVKGGSDTLEEDLTACLRNTGNAVGIIEGPLMDGMRKVGEMFGCGKMFLPQVVKSAKVMRQAVDILQPYMQQEHDADTSRRPKVVIATVKGDVHDIGKNITAIVLGCNGFDVIDLGVMVDKETIIDTAEAEHADIIAASGLITPSLYQMEELCREMASRGMTTPLFIGGATTSALHTAVKLAPLYGHVFYGQDASASAVMAKEYMADRSKFEQEEHHRQESLRKMYRMKNDGHDDRGEARDGNGHCPERTDNKKDTHVFAPESYPVYGSGINTEDIPVCNLGITDVMPYFDWRMFYAIWGVKYGKMAPDEPAMAGLRKEAEEVLSRLSGSGRCLIMLGVKWFAANACGNDMILRTSADPAAEGKTAAVLPMMRQEEPYMLPDGRAVRLSLADFAAPEDCGFASPAGVFAISVRNPDQPHDTDTGNSCRCGNCIPAGDYDNMMERSVMDTLAEAASTWIDNRISEGIPDGHRLKIIKPAAGYASCPDHTLKRDILRLIPDSDRLGITLTESCGMLPDASICGMIFIHPEATYPEIRRIGRHQYDDYAARRGMTAGDAYRFLGHLLDE